MRHHRLITRASPLILTLFVAALLATPTTAAAQTTPQPVDLGTLGGTSSGADDINDHGVVAGSATTGAFTDDGMPVGHAFRWRNGHMTDLGSLGGWSSGATAINKWGEIVGTSLTREENNHAFLWRHGHMTDLTPEEWDSSAIDINDQGDIVGLIGANGFIWRQGRMTDLGDFQPAAINNLGQIVGYATFPDPVWGEVSDAAMWDHGIVTRLDKLTGFDSSYVNDINDQGSIAGYSLGFDPMPINHATWWQNGVPMGLGAPDTVSQALAINNRDQIVGWSDAVGNDAFLWDHGVTTVLDSLPGFRSTSANAINNYGQIVGTSSSLGEDATDHAVLWR